MNQKEAMKIAKSEIEFKAHLLKYLERIAEALEQTELEQRDLI